MSEKKKLEPLVKILIDWINSELADKRVIIKDIQEDIYDGQILQMLIGEFMSFKVGIKGSILIGLKI
jgi:parvin